MAMLRGQPDFLSGEASCRDDRPGSRRAPHSPQNFLAGALRVPHCRHRTARRAPQSPQNVISAAMRQVGRSARTAGDSQIRYTAWLAEGPRARRLGALVLDVLLAAHCTQVPLGSACPLILRKPAGML